MKETTRLDFLIFFNTGSDVTRQVAHIVLADDNFVSMINGVKEGRRIFLSIKKFVVHVLATNIGMVLLLMVGLSFRDVFWEVVYPQSPLEILLLNMYVLSVPLIGLVQLFLPSSSFFLILLLLTQVTEPPDFDVMSEPPRKSRFVLTRDVLCDIFVYGVILGSCAIAAFSASLYGVYGGNIGILCNSHSGFNCEDVQRARATTFLAVTFMLIFSAQNNRDPYDSVWTIIQTRRWNKYVDSNFQC